MPRPKQPALRPARPVDLDHVVARALDTSADRARTAILQARAVDCLWAAAECLQPMARSQRAIAGLDPNQQACFDVIRATLVKVSPVASVAHVPMDVFVSSTGVGVVDVRLALKALRRRRLVRTAGPAEHRLYTLIGANERLNV